MGPSALLAGVFAALGIEVRYQVIPFVFALGFALWVAAGAGRRGKVAIAFGAGMFGTLRLCQQPMPGGCTSSPCRPIRRRSRPSSSAPSSAGACP